MSPQKFLVDLSLRRPKLVLWAVLALTLLASIGFTRINVDTDPENMLPADDPVRLRNAELEEVFGSGPLIVLGIFGEVTTVDGIEAISSVHQSLVARQDVTPEATVSIHSVVETLPTSEAEVAALVAQVETNQLLAGNILFADEPGAAIFIAITDKSAAVDVADAARDLVAAEPALATAEVEVGGLPLAEDAFGKQMFVQMGIFAPLAGLLVFLSMLFFFRRLMLVIPAMLLAMATVIVTMGSLVGSGNSLHIMSSMIPIFLMPIAILDSVHVLSDFFEKYSGGDRSPVVKEVLAELARPLSYTSLTTAVGFGSLMLVPIPPVRVFGFFVALGVALAWLFTMTLLPAFMVLAPEKHLVSRSAPSERRDLLGLLGTLVLKFRAAILIAMAIVTALAIPGLASTTVNDNPVRWFRADHEIRVASDRLGEALPGTFTASLLVSETVPGALDDPETMASIQALVDVLSDQDEVGAVQSYLAGDHPVLRAGDQANIRMQLRNGDNTSMAAVVDAAEAQLEAEPLANVDVRWAGEAYLNLTWQEDMVSGMLVGFATTLVVIFVLLVLLFRSLKWSLLAMMPVLATIIVVYGAMAYAGRDMDMPVAVLSTMVVGIGVDFAIHFVERFRSLHEELGSALEALVAFYGEPARAMTRNAVVVAVGFSPLVLSSLVPYIVVGALMASIIALSWLASLFALPAAVSYTADSRK